MYCVFFLFQDSTVYLVISFICFTLWHLHHLSLSFMTLSRVLVTCFIECPPLGFVFFLWWYGGAALLGRAPRHTRCISLPLNMIIRLRSFLKLRLFVFLKSFFWDVCVIFQCNTNMLLRLHFCLLNLSKDLTCGNLKVMLFPLFLLHLLIATLPKEELHDVTLW